ncbi:MAG: hypothetical protein ACOCWM_06145 [Cyclobacteriaceae bacterium]
MNTLELKEMNLIEINNKTLCEIDGGIVLGWNWGMLWRGVGIGVAGGTAGAAVALAAC